MVECVISYFLFSILFGYHNTKLENLSKNDDLKRQERRQRLHQLLIRAPNDILECFCFLSDPNHFEDLLFWGPICYLFCSFFW